LTRSIAVGASTLVLGVVGAAAASARITVNRGVGSIGLGMTAKQVRARLGAPSLESATGGSRNYVYRRRALVVSLVGSRVVIISTRNSRERTATGIGVGSTDADVLRRVAGARCATKADVRFCRVGSIRPGRRSTTFQIQQGRVVTITVARGQR
jgi:outer membrane protein assembly factor BamE (lipoprotein component of BamABCDE complex)